MPSVLEELRWRGLVALTTDEEALAAALASGPVTVYCGFDPTAPSLHFGNLVQLIVLRWMQRAGHRVICLVGGSTGLIGDPRPTAERVLKTREQTADWVDRIRAQVRPFLEFEGENPALLVDNLDWTAPISALDFLRDIGKHFRVNAMLRKEAVAARLSSEEGISYTEFSYQILQALDFLHLYREYGCTLQTGGQDQWGNLTAGVDLIRRVEGAGVHVLATPLITDSAGVKFGKSEGNAVWLSADMTSPYAFYQYWINVEDASVVLLLKAFTERSAEEIAELERATVERPQARAAQRALAADVTALVHGRPATDAVIRASRALFGQDDLAAVDAATLRAALEETGLHRVSDPSPTVVALLRESGLAASNSEARRTVAEGGAYLNNRRMTDPDEVPGDAELLHGRYLVVRRGKRHVAGVEISAG
ncbi:tyrosine--tRNA ligase [Nakamurella endophytica]|uniref:tyrosine--tRNA ligase n=1 Tax=Nakamurella endophytica TaxID=1748367 RepID=UPI00166F17B7|nr:tyrosine--tRNA ligase [Nakamurella endophytica]